MIIPKIAKSSSSYFINTHKMIKIPKIRKLIKLEDKKESTIQNKPKKKYFSKKLKFCIDQFIHQIDLILLQWE